MTKNLGVILAVWALGIIGSLVLVVSEWETARRYDDLVLLGLAIVVPIVGLYLSEKGER